VTFDPARHRRRSLRLRGYDYAQAGAYFVTICTQGRECLFGEVADGEMRQNDAGRIIELVWNEMPVFYHGVDIDGFVVMPNHVHGILILVGATPRGRPGAGQARGPAPTGHEPAPTLSVPDLVQRFKTLTTKRYADGVQQSGWPPFPGRLWQGNYYEHIIRDEDSLKRIREYIANNPLQWALDRENPHPTPALGEPRLPRDEPWRT